MPASPSERRRQCVASSEHLRSGSKFLDVVSSYCDYVVYHRRPLPPLEPRRRTAAERQEPGMTDASPRSLDEPTRDALLQLVIEGMHRGAVSPAQQALVDAGLAMAKGPLIMPTPAGTTAAQELTRLPAGGDEEKALRPLFEKFLPVNHELREICSAWQLRPDGGVNDHGDAAYDASVRDRLDDVDESIGRILRRMADIQPRLGHYRADLTAALEKLDDGDPSSLTSPLSRSYHTVWMHLHQELLLLLGISRAEDERLETELVRGQKV